MGRNAIVRYNGPRKADSWARWMNGRVMRSNKNNLIIYTGQTGSGKTYSAISVAEKLSELSGAPFTLDHIVFTVEEVLHLINSGELQRGSVIIFDEPGIEIGKMKYMSKLNQMFVSVASSFRYMNLTLFFCTPYMTDIDKSTRKLIHAVFPTRSINHSEKSCKLGPRYIQYADWREEPYRKKLIVWWKEKDRWDWTKLDYWDVPHPSKSISEPYEVKRDKYIRGVLRNAEEVAKANPGLGGAQVGTEPDRKPLTDRQKEVMTALANVDGENRFEEVKKKLGISLNAIHQNKVLAEKKGYIIDEFVSKTKKSIAMEVVESK